VETTTESDAVDDHHDGKSQEDSNDEPYQHGSEMCHGFVGHLGHDDDDRHRKFVLIPGPMPLLLTMVWMEQIIDGF
jgi:hypothetical protein